MRVTQALSFKSKLNDVPPVLKATDCLLNCM
jgi:hypothetical protein